MTASPLEEHRKKIDALDKALINLLKQRFDVAYQVAHIKQGQGIPVRIPHRIEAVLNHVREEAVAQGLNPVFIQEVWSLIIEETCLFEENFLAQNASHNQNALHNQNPPQNDSQILCEDV
jgi:chorismate mutase-like protein